MNRRFFSLLCVAWMGLFIASAKADDWPQWRGPNRDGVSKETGLATKWPEDGPKLAWKTSDLGKGYSTPSVAKGQIYVVGTPDGKIEQLIALREADGKQLWSTDIGAVCPNRGPNYPGPRSTPTVDGERVYVLSSDGDLACLTTADGKVAWQKSLRKDFDGKPGNWAYAESVLIDGENLICSPGGSKATVVALNKNDGSVVWQCAVPGGDPAGFASAVVGEVGGIRQYIQFLGKGLVGIEAKSGRFLWRYDHTSNGSMNAPTPIFRDGSVLSASTRKGAGLAKLAAEGDKVTPTEVYFLDKLQNHHGGLVLVGDSVYGTGSQALMCVDFATGKVQWEDRSVGKGSISAADGRLYVRGENGQVALVEANPAAYKELGRFTPEGSSPKNCWAHPVIANGHLLLRDQGMLYSYDVKAADKN
ncbi:MAG TPA: PQQ-binding-like beta-propeller repeat protein [Pirellulales bacterium]